jgi:hypothetical protein
MSTPHRCADRETLVEPAGDATWRIRVVVENAGWLPTNISRQAIDQGAVQPVVATIALGADSSLVTGTERIELGQLSGRALKDNSVASLGQSDDTSDRAVAEWIVAAPVGAAIDVEIRHDRAGVVRTSVTLG